MIVTIPIKTVSEANQRCHWAVKAKRAKSQRDAASWAIGWQVTHPLPCTVTMIRIAPRSLDDDNLRGALKAARDGIADRLGVKDNDPRVKWEYGQRSGAPKQYAVEVQIQATE